MSRYYFSYLVVSPDKKRWIAGVATSPARFMDDHWGAVDEQGEMPYQHDMMAYAEKILGEDEAKTRAAELNSLSMDQKEQIVNQSNPEWKDLSYNPQFSAGLPNEDGYIIPNKE